MDNKITRSMNARSELTSC